MASPGVHREEERWAWRTRPRRYSSQSLASDWLHNVLSPNGNPTGQRLPVPRESLWRSSTSSPSLAIREVYSRPSSTLAHRVASTFWSCRHLHAMVNQPRGYICGRIPSTPVDVVLTPRVMLSTLGSQSSLPHQSSCVQLGPSVGTTGRRDTSSE